MDIVRKSSDKCSGMNRPVLMKKELSEKETLVAIASLLIAILAISFAAILIKLSESEISPNATVFNRLWIAALVFGLWNGISAIFIDHKPDQYEAHISPNTIQVSGLLVLLGVTYAAFQDTWAWSITQTSVAISTVLHNLTPVFTSLGAWLIFSQRFDRRFWFGMVLALGGVAAIGLEDYWQIATGKIEGDFAALISAIFYGGYILILEQLRSKLNPTIILMWSSLIGAVIVLPILLITQDKLFPYFWQGWLAVICLGIICHVVGHGLIAYSLYQLSASFVAVFLLLDPVLTAIEAWIIFSERLSLLSWTGFYIILFGIYLQLYPANLLLNRTNLWIYSY